MADMDVFFGFSSSQWWVSKIIMRATRAKVSHAFLLLKGTDLGDLVYEAGWDGWRASTPEALTSGTTRIVELVPVPPSMRAAVTAAVVASRSSLGEGYDYEGLLGMAWVELAAKWLRKKVKNPFRSARTMFCSDAVVALILQPAKWPYSDLLDAQSISPEDLLEFVKIPLPAEERKAA
jgi:hypothetical protein